MKSVIKKLANIFGYDINQRPALLLRNRMKIISSYRINHIFDVGANVGQYGLQLRDLNYGGKISSFEPITSVFEKLCSASSSDKLWDSYNYALGDTDKNSVINISNTDPSSSILAMLPSHLNASPTSKYIDTEPIEIKSIDSIFKEVVDIDDKLMLKLDVQGYEENVLNGAKLHLKEFRLLQIELSVECLYEKELGFIKMLELLEALNFKLVSLEPGFYDKNTGFLLQVDGIFLNTKRSSYT